MKTIHAEACGFEWNCARRHAGANGPLSDEAGLEQLDLTACPRAHANPFSCSHLKAAGFGQVAGSLVRRAQLHEMTASIAIFFEQDQQVCKPPNWLKQIASHCALEKSFRVWVPQEAIQCVTLIFLLMQRAKQMKKKLRGAALASM